MLKKCALLWREAHFEVKIRKAHHIPTTFGHSSVVLCGRRKGLCALPKVNQTCGAYSHRTNDDGRRTFQGDLQKTTRQEKLEVLQWQRMFFLMAAAGVHQFVGYRHAQLFVPMFRVLSLCILITRWLPVIGIFHGICFFKSSPGGHVVLATHAICFSQLPCLFFWQQPVGCSRHAQWCCVVFRVSSRLRQEVSCFAGSLHPVSLGTCRFVLSDSWKRILGQHVVFASFIFFASPLSLCPRLRLHARSNCVFATFLLSYSAT